MTQRDRDTETLKGRDRDRGTEEKGERSEERNVGTAMRTRAHQDGTGRGAVTE